MTWSLITDLFNASNMENWIVCGDFNIVSHANKK